MAKGNRMNNHRTFFSHEWAESRIDGLRTGWVTVKAPSLGHRGDISVFLPEESENLGPLPWCILLHGIYGSHWAWLIKGRAHMVFQEMINSGVIPPMIAIMPSDGLWGDGSGYVPHSSGQDYEKWIVEDVPGAVKLAWKDIDISGPAFISGLSMGGFGALRIGARYGKIFSGISAHSSVTALDQLSPRVERTVTLPHPDHGPHDLELSDAILRHRDSIPPFRFDCGTSDALIHHNRSLHKCLERESVPHHYEEFSGDHDWSYWHEHLPDSLRFFGQLLGK